MLTLLKSDDFAEWEQNLKDLKGRARITARILNASLGHFGDCRSVGDGVFEMRIDFGPGYRIYYTRACKIVYLLLIGGDKSTQQKDIKKAKMMAKELM